ncbi:phage tail family protein [Streptomyces sp. ISL-94]|uniref:phage distal tail protein n=1 Tax=Streptomyces sp. ISL-94 TaxID=2819190 RepID=UPI001BE66001|nr:phage tail family protein [Streptomyces sp. ISL-94]MBT2477653.1 phage tail family protein [Streptomyces sp. ISL-94]
MATLLGLLPVTLGSLDLLATDGAGVDWVVTDLKGWDSPGVRSESAPRQADHGTWASPVYLDSRPITITGSIDAPTQGARDAAVEQLVAAVALTDTLLTVGEAIPKQVTVRRSSPLLIELLGPYAARYSALVTAADPRRYSTTLQSKSTGLPSVTGGLTLPITLPISISTTATGGAFTLDNEGSIATRPTFTITGPASMPIISCTRPDGTVTQLIYSDSLGAGDTLVINTAAHTVTLNGAVSRRRYLSGAWPEILPASSLSVQWSALAYDAAAMLTGICRSAWM